MIPSNYDPEILYGDPNGPYPDGDIRNRNPKTIPDIDLYVCGFPCQPFSIAGPQKGFGHKSGNVFFSCLEVIKEKQPKYFILENVRGLIHHQKGSTWQIITDELEKLSKIGYEVKYKILNTKDYGIPQNRERIFIVCSNNMEWSWPEKNRDE
jgi:DNA (cytosine-5)-methyltransferase 1